FRRVRSLLIRPRGCGMLANTLHFDYEIRPAEKLFEDIPSARITGEMLDLAAHIIESKEGEFDPSGFDDRYDTALAELVKAKMEGRKIEKRKQKPEGKVIDLMQSLRDSAKAAEKDRRKSDGKSARATRKAG